MIKMTQDKPNKPGRYFWSATTSEVDILEVEYFDGLLSAEMGESGLVPVSALPGYWAECTPELFSFEYESPAPQSYAFYRQNYGQIWGGGGGANYSADGVSVGYEPEIFSGGADSGKVLNIYNGDDLICTAKTKSINLSAVESIDITKPDGDFDEIVDNCKSVLVPRLSSGEIHSDPEPESPKPDIMDSIRDAVKRWGR